MLSVLITGSNSGIGLALTQQYVDSNYHVKACCREPENAKQLQVLKAKRSDSIDIYQLDVSKEEDIMQLTECLKGKPIDILINNAGVWGQADQQFGALFGFTQQWLDAFKVNTIAPVLLTEALFNNLVQGEYKLVVNISSDMGSIELNSSGGCYVYRSSKTALNAMTKNMAVDLKQHGITVISMHPGWVRTEMGGENGLLSPKSSAQGIFHVLNGISTKESGCFKAYNGLQMAW